MRKERPCQPGAVRFRRFMRKGYAAFRSLHRVVNIGVVAIGVLSFALPDSANGQQMIRQAEAQEETPIELDELEVTASRAPIALNQAAKIVTVITAPEIASSPVTSIQELLAYAAGVDVRQRGAGGTQSDISIRGGTFDQIAVLLNGVNLSNPQTGHYSFDLPVNLSDIERIEILSGPSSRIFGASAFAGAINIITKTATSNSFSTDNYAGMYETWKVEAGLDQASSHFHQRLSAGYASSGGYRPNTGYRQLNAFWQSEVPTSSGDFRFQAGYNDKAYGANSFYSAAYPSQYDHTRRFFLSAGGETKGRIRLIPRVYWTRHFDNYELIRHEDKGHNYHETEVYGVTLNAVADWLAGRTTAGMEFRSEGVRSNVLGLPMPAPIDVPFTDGAQYLKSYQRTNVSYFLEHNVLLQRFTLSVGVLANYVSTLNQGMRFYPGIDASYRILDNVRVYGSWNKALRMPTFTDLFYESPVILGNPNLRPEESEAFEAGIKYANHFLRGHVAGFYRKGTDMIDWVKKRPEDVWESRNLTSVDNLGVETALTLLPRELAGDRFFVERLTLGYAYIHQNKDSEDWISNYALEYLRHKFTARLDHRIWRYLTATWQMRWQDRVGGYTRYENGQKADEVPYEPYAVTDLRINWQRRKLTVYAEVNNLFDVGYYDLGNIPQPGICVLAGFSYKLSW